MISLVVPAYNERQNIPELVDRAGRALMACSPEYELVIVDDNSPDGTADEVRRLQEGRPWLKLLVRTNEKDLSTAVTAGWNLAKGDVLGCMDGDLQHPPEILPALYGRLQKTGSDIVVGSRHIAGGGVSDWSWHRRFVSWSATLMATVILPGTLGQVRDPMSGFFLLRRGVLDGAGLRPLGYKILLEVLARGNYSKITEVPFIFDERSHGSSKMNASIMRKYIRHLLRISVDTGEAMRMVKFALVGLSGVAVNYFVYRELAATLKWTWLPADLCGIGAAIVSNFIWNELFTFWETRRAEPGLTKTLRRFALFVVFSAVGAAINLALSQVAGVVTGISVAAVWNFLLSSNVIWQAWWNRKLMVRQ
jgi:dolichol-phosphate mannosyltransferase